MTDCDVIVVGAGPVGLLAALLTERRGLRVVLLEQSERRHIQSRAVGIMPPSLEILRTIDLDGRFSDEGVQVRVAEAHGRRGLLGRLDFSLLKGAFPFVLSLPQDRTEALLEEAVLSRQGIRFLRGHRVMECAEADGGVEMSGESAAGRFRFTAPHALACDGGRSTVRQALGIPFDGGTEQRSFIMGDFTDTSGWGERAVFFLTPRGSVESFPLPGDRRRYVLRTPVYCEEFAADYFRAELLYRAGVDIAGVRRYWQSSFRVQRYLAGSFCSAGVFLCGDAAHLMSPVGGQNMNVGFADAEMASWLVGHLMKGRLAPARASRLYQSARKRAARSASRRARILTAAGTSGGRLWSASRNGAAALILGSPLRRRLPRNLSMYSIPFCNLSRSRFRLPGELMQETRAEAG